MDRYALKLIMQGNENSERYQKLFLEQLKEMFIGANIEDMRKVCEREKWNIDKCLDIFVNNYNEKPPKEVIPVKKLESKPAFDFAYVPASTGAISKWSHSTPHKSAFTPYNKPANEFVPNGAKKKFTIVKQNWELKEEAIIKNIVEGYRVMIFMRGPSGCGKSYMARGLLKKLPAPYNEYPFSDFICSTDSYFYEGNKYYFRKNMLQEFHLKNQAACVSKAAKGYSPIIIDNTNLQLWEMMPYVKFGMTYGYMIEILEPETPWRNSASKLAAKSKHGVPKHSIENALERYQKLTVQDIMKRCDSEYKNMSPRKRKYPQLKIEPVVNFDEEGAVGGEENQSMEIIEVDINKLKIDESSDASTSRNLSEKPVLKLPTVSYEDEDDSEVQNRIKQMLLDRKTEFERHTVGCPNEHPSFILFRTIYPYKNIEGIWDLFVKCNGDVDWSVDILMQEAESGYIKQDDENDLAVDKFQCNCNGIKKSAVSSKETTESIPLKYNTPEVSNVLPSKRKQRNFRNTLSSNSEEVKRTVENWFQLNDNQFNEQVRLHILEHKSIKENERKSIKLALELHEALQKDLPLLDEVAAKKEEEQDEEEEKDAFIKLSFGQELVSQLSAEFQGELSLSHIMPESLTRNVDVWLPRELAKEMYMVWLESIYSISEDERAEMVRNDEEIALQLAKQEPNTMPEKFNTAPNIDLATHLTLQNLYDDNPNIPKDTLYNIFCSTNNNYQATTALLKEFADCKQLRKDCIGMSSESSNEEASVQAGSEHNTPKHQMPVIPKEELKKRAIKEFEETRNSAAYHARLKFECYRRAQEAIQLGNHGAALYYSEVSRMHKDKIDHYNHKAANCIMNVHKMTTKNPDLLDLHYLHLSEALVCLDIFLDRHQARLQALKLPYKKVFIITGRGLHSAMGISTIKSHVKGRMRERNIRWMEVNPGLLKVKLFRNGAA